jgi:hypothetical protein
MAGTRRRDDAPGEAAMRHRFKAAWVALSLASSSAFAGDVPSPLVFVQRQIPDNGSIEVRNRMKSRASTGSISRRKRRTV